VFLFLITPFLYVDAFSSIYNFESKSVKDSIKQKVSQTSEEYVESFDELWEDRYEFEQTNGTFSRWDSSLANGQYSLSKWEDETTLNPNINQSILGSTYDNIMKCNSFSNVSNEYCASANLEYTTVVPAGGWLSGYSFRKQITITGSPDGDLINYKMDFTLNYTTGTDFDYTIHLDSKAKSDFSDIRFTSSTGSNQLNYSLINTIDSDYSKVVVIVPEIKMSTNITYIYLYWGNPSATDESDTTIFNFYDDFEDPTTITDTSKWTKVVTGGCVLSVETISGTNKVVIDVLASSACGIYLRFNNTNQQYASGTKIKNFYDVEVLTVTDTYTDFEYWTTFNVGAALYEVLPNVAGTNSIQYYYYTGSSYANTNPVMPYFTTIGAQYYFATTVSSSSISAEREFTQNINNTDHLASNGAISTSAYDQDISSIHFGSNNYDSARGFTRSAYAIDNFAVINKTQNEPAISTTSSELGINYVGFLNNSDARTGGINRLFPGINITNLISIESNSASVKGFDRFYFTTEINSSGLANGSALEFFIYSMNESDILDNTSLTSWTAIQKQEFWNTTSQPIYSNLFIKETNFTDTTGYYSFDLTDLADYWLAQRTTQTLFGVGVQLYNLNQATDYNTTAQPDSNYVDFSSTFNFDIEFQIELADSASKSISTQVEAKEELVTSIHFTYQNSSNTYFSNANRFEYEVALETASGSTLSKTHYFKAVVLDPSGLVVLQWRTTSGAQANYSTSVNLESLKSYRFTFQLSKSDGKLSFSILNSTSDQVLRPRSWQTYVSNEVTDRPSFFSAQPLSENWSGNTSESKSKRGYAITLRTTSNYVITGTSQFDIDQIYSSAGLLDTGFYCRAQDNNPINTCPVSSIQDFNDISPYSANWNNLSTSTRITYQYKIRDFRSMTGIIKVNSTDPFSDPLDVESIRISFYAYPINTDGTLGDLIATYLSISNKTGGYNVWGHLQDNISIFWKFPDLPAGKPNVNYAFGLYWTNDRTLGLSLKYYDVGISTTQPVSATTYGNYDSSVTQDVLVILQYEINYGNKYDTDGGQLQFTDLNIQKGRNLEYSIPSIPNPDVPYIPPSLIDDIFSGIGGFWDTLASGDIFGALGGVWDALVNGLTDGFNWLATQIWNVIFDIVIPWLQGIIFAIFDWFLDSFYLRDSFNATAGLLGLLIVIPVLIWLAMVGICMSGPWVYALGGHPSEAPANIIVGYQKIWTFDITFGFSPFGVVPRIPMGIAMIILSIIFATIYNIRLIQTLIPF
jgi:hypothetical protein